MTLAMPFGFSDTGQRKHFTKDTGCSNSKSIYTYRYIVCVSACVCACIIILVSRHVIHCDIFMIIYFTSICLLPPPPFLSLSLTGVLKSLLK